MLTSQSSMPRALSRKWPSSGVPAAAAAAAAEAHASSASAASILAARMIVLLMLTASRGKRAALRLRKGEGCAWESLPQAPRP